MCIKEGLDSRRHNMGSLKIPLNYVKDHCQNKLKVTSILSEQIVFLYLKFNVKLKTS